MVIDTLENLEKYVSLNPLFNDVVDFLKSNDLNIQVAKGKSCESALLETHKKMIDIQIPLSTSETYGYTPLKDLPEAEYNEEKDITKYEGAAATYVTCKPGEFAMFFPQDGHAPCISEQAEIKKAIFKVLA